jgi:hypothetical protein
LTDAESLERGIGPVCSKKYYNPLHIPTAKMIQEALGLLQASKLPDNIIDAFLKVVNNRRRNARKGCNILVYWASCNYQERGEVFKCSGIIRALGYTELADKLEVDRTVVRIENMGAYLLAYIPNQWKLKRNVACIPGNDPLLDNSEHPRKMGHKVGWKIPIKQEAYFLTLLGCHCRGEMACNSKGVWHIKPASWQDLREFQNPQTPTRTPAKSNRSRVAHGGGCQVKSAGNVYEIYTPYCAPFKDELKRLVPYRDRKWTGKCWTVASRHLDLVKELVKNHFGVAI